MKTRSGRRTVPLTDAVVDALLTVCVARARAGAPGPMRYSTFQACT